MPAYRSYFSALVAHETALWNAIDRRMLRSGALRLGRLEYLRALRALSGARIQDIADSLGTTVGAASKLTDRLVADGLVQRLPHPTDRRSSLVQLTSAGAAALATGEAAFEESIAAIIGTLDVETVATLSSLLRTAQAAVANAEVEK